MNIRHLILCLSTSAVGACVSAPGVAGASAGAGRAQADAAETADADSPPARLAHPDGAGRPADPDASGKPGLSEMELKIWNEPAFKRRFTQSYIAETEIEPRVTRDERETMQEVLELISSDKLDEAAEMLREHRGDAASAVFDFTLANIHFQQEDLERAAELYEVAVEKHQKFRRAWSNLGKIHVRRGDFEKAVPALSRVIELGGGDGLTYGLLGYAHASTENHMPAETAYRRAILLDSETMDWKLGLARSLFQQNRYAEVASLLDRLIADNPSRSDLWLLQANAYIGLDQPLSAAQNYEFVDQMGESSAESLSMLGDIYVNEELYELAVRAYIRAIEMTPEQSPDRAIRAAQVLAARGAHNETRRIVKKIEAVKGDRLEDEQRRELLMLRARVAVADGASGEHVRVLERIVELDPMDGEALMLLGRHHSRTGDNERATFYYERAANIDGYEADAKVRHAQILVENGKYKEALPLLRSAQKINPRENIQEYLDQVQRLAQRNR